MSSDPDCSPSLGDYHATHDYHDLEKILNASLDPSKHVEPLRCEMLLYLSRLLLDIYYRSLENGEIGAPCVAYHDKIDLHDDSAEAGHVEQVVEGENEWFEARSHDDRTLAMTGGRHILYDFQTLSEMIDGLLGLHESSWDESLSATRLRANEKVNEFISIDENISEDNETAD